MKTVFVLGAGASRAAGGPLMYDFIDLAARVLRRGEAGWAQEHFEVSLEARRKLQHAYVKSTIDLDNIENLFATYGMASLIGRLSNLDTQLVKGLPTSLRYLIMRTLEQSILYPLTGRDHTVVAPYPYAAFAELLLEMQSLREFAPLAIINFNYDLCLDYALALKGVPVNYGLGGAAKHAPRGVPHYKVHGSLNWFRDGATSLIEAAPLKPMLAKTYWDRLGLDREAERPIDTMELLFGSEKWGESLHPEPIIVPPTWNKGWYQEQLRTVWTRASEALSSAENIFVIGYSLPPSDQFFRAFWSLSTISDSVIERFWLFDPSGKSDIVDRFSSMLGPAIMDRGKFRYEALKFTGAIKFIANYLGFKEEVELMDR
ncbi:MAG TPA: hypothetical protein VFL64_00445 [Rhizobacter sp.]|nr:hypothetical protein [Rhizobacter sp.]